MACVSDKMILQPLKVWAVEQQHGRKLRTCEKQLRAQTSPTGLWGKWGDMSKALALGAKKVIKSSAILMQFFFCED